MAHGGGPSKRKSNLHIDDSGSEDEVPPPDGGWGWVGNFKFLCILIYWCANNINQFVLFKWDFWINEFCFQFVFLPEQVIVAASFLIHIISKLYFLLLYELVQDISTSKNSMTESMQTSFNEIFSFDVKRIHADLFSASQRWNTSSMEMVITMTISVLSLCVELIKTIFIDEKVSIETNLICFLPMMH